MDQDSPVCSVLWLSANQKIYNCPVTDSLLSHIFIGKRNYLDHTFDTIHRVLPEMKEL